MRPQAILDLDHTGTRKHPPIRLDAEIKGLFYLERWHLEDQGSDNPRRMFSCVTKHFMLDSLTFEFRSQHPRAVVKDRLFVQVPGIGLLRGVVTRPMGAVIQMDVEMSEPERPRYASKLLYLHKQSSRHFQDNRPFPRYRPTKAASAFSIDGSRSVPCSIRSLSPSGAEVVTEARPKMRTRLALGQVGGEVVGHTDDGFDMSFFRAQNPMLLDDLVAVDMPEHGAHTLPLSPMQIVGTA